MPIAAVIALALLVLPVAGLTIGMVASAAVPVLGWVSGDVPAPADAHASSLSWAPVPVRPGRSAACRAARARAASLRAHRAGVALAMGSRA